MKLKSLGKTRLPQNWLYPISLQKINEFLLDTHNDKEEAIWFYHNADQWFPKKHKRVHIENSYIELLHVHFYLEESSRKKIWILRVNSVPNNFKSTIEEYILKDAMPRIKKWLMHRFTEIQVRSRPSCVLGINNEKDSYLWIQNKNGQEKPSVEKLGFQFRV